MPVIKDPRDKKKRDVDLMSKRALLREYDTVVTMADKYLRLSIVLAVELYRFDPDSPVFTGETFTPESIEGIKAECAKLYDNTKKRGLRFRFGRWLIGKAVPVAAALLKASKRK